MSKPPDAPLQNIHSTFLAPYYSLTSNETLGFWLTTLCNAVIEASAADANAKTVVCNIEIWSKDLHRTQKPLMLLAIEKRSHFTFDMLHWIKHITKLLTAVALAPSADRPRENRETCDVVHFRAVLDSRR
jgi:hypothetical protein